MERRSILSISEVFLPSELMNKALQYKGLRMGELRHDREAHSEPIGTYELDSKLREVLRGQKICIQSRPEPDILTFVDENPQETYPGWSPSNYWNFIKKDGKFDLRIALFVSATVDTKKRGVVLRPRARGTHLSPADKLPNFRMFRALVGTEEAQLPVVSEIKDSDGSIVVSWTELGLGGIRTLVDLFAEFTNSKEVRDLADHGIFTPEPIRTTENQLYVIEPAQPKVFDAWRKQLEEYRSKLVA